MRKKPQFAYWSQWPIEKIMGKMQKPETAKQNIDIPVENNTNI